MRFSHLIATLIAASALSALSLKMLPLPFVWILLLWSVVFIVVAVAHQGQIMKRMGMSAASTCLVLFTVEVLLWTFPGLVSGSGQHGPLVNVGTYANGYFRKRIPHLGYGSMPGMTFTSTCLAGNGDVIYDVVYSIDEAGLRVTPPARTSDVPAVVFFGCSFTFGEGVQDNEAMPYRVAERCDRNYRVLNLGFHGYGPHQMLSAIENGLVDTMLKGTQPRVFIYQALPEHAGRCARPSQWDIDGPMYVLTDATDLRHAGTFRQHHRFAAVNAYMARQLQKSAIGRRLPALSRPPGPTTADDDLMAAIVVKTRNRIKEKWPDAQFHVLLWDDATPTAGRLIECFQREDINLHCLSKALPEIQANPSAYRIPVDNHPNAKAHDRIAGYVVDEIVGADRAAVDSQEVGSGVNITGRDSPEASMSIIETR